MLLPFLATFAALAAPAALSQSQPLALRAASLSRPSVPRFGTIELTLDLSAAYQNPFDPDDIDVEADFTGPQGQTRRAAGFLDQPFARRLEGGTEQWDARGEPVWRVRFTPDAAGTWRVRVTARDKTGTASLPSQTFQVTASKSPGFVRRSVKNPRAFAFDTGKPFFAVGENIGWGGKRGSFDYDDWLVALGKAGGNWGRVWMCSWNCGLEWTEEAKGDRRSGGYHGLGVYSLDNAAKLDQILETAQKNNVHIMLCLGTFGELTTGGFFNEGQWKANPYNAANGGPCAAPDEFWTNPQARKLYRQRLRYILARWGARTNIQAWEFWNETNPPASWVAEMARFVKANDPYRHLVTTSYGSDAIWKLADVDFSQTHNYGTGNIADHAPVVHDDAAQSAVWNKPHLMGEFGIDYRKSDADYDPDGQGVNFHNGLWASALSGNAGGAMLWWWDNYVAPKNLYSQFTGLRRFADAVPWTAGIWKPLAADPPRVANGPETFSDLVLPVNGSWGKSSHDDFTVTPFGVAEGRQIGAFLYSPGKADLRTTPTFHVRFVRPGRFVVHVAEVSDRARLQFRLNGRPVADFSLSATPSDPHEYEKTELRPEYNSYLARFNRDYGIDIPMGSHTVTLDTTEGDWLSLESVTLTGYRSSRFPAVNFYGLHLGRQAIFWAQNAAHDWKNVAEKKPIRAVTGATVTLRGLPNGRYNVEWWDTTQGKATGRSAAVSARGMLTLRLPELATDVAARVTPLKPSQPDVKGGQ